MIYEKAGIVMLNGTDTAINLLKHQETASLFAHLTPYDIIHHTQIFNMTKSASPSKGSTRKKIPKKTTPKKLTTESSTDTTTAIDHSNLTHLEESTPLTEEEELQSTLYENDSDVDSDDQKIKDETNTEDETTSIDTEDNNTPGTLTYNTLDISTLTHTFEHTLKTHLKPL